MKPEKGMLALCSRGQLGLITQDYYPGGAALGIHLEDHPEFGVKVGDPWQSKNPKVLASLTAIVRHLRGE